jgi:hypothetical protein
MPRTKAIFDWIFALDDDDVGLYKLFYLASPNIGLSDDALQARIEKEAKSEKTVNAFAIQYRKMAQVWWFLNSQHDLYSASRLVERARGEHHLPLGSSETAELIKASYGGIR